MECEIPKNEKKEYHTPSEPPEALTEELQKAKQDIKSEIYQRLMEAADSVNTPIQSESILKQYLERELKKQQNYIKDEIHRFEISAALDALQAENIPEYQVVCESYYEACDACKSLHRKRQPVSEAEEGVTLPPLHPNCRCTIGSYMESVSTDSANLIDQLFNIILGDTTKSIILPLHKIFKNFVEKSAVGTIIDLALCAVGLDVPVHMMRQPYLSYKETIDQGTECYYFDSNNLQSPLLINGEIVFSSNLSDLDRQILALMKMRDVSTSEQEIARLSRQLSQLAAGSSASIDISKPYTYYEMGRDTTDEILQLMKETERKYAEQKKRGWAVNLLFFKNIVQNNGELDLKNRSAYQTNATYVFDGEIVDRDALGNITYGYFGRYLGIPITMLLAGAGYVQGQAGTAEWTYFNTYGDDLSDQYRILQGILLYDQIQTQK